MEGEKIHLTATSADWSVVENFVQAARNLNGQDVFAQTIVGDDALHHGDVVMTVPDFGACKQRLERIMPKMGFGPDSKTECARMRVLDGPSRGANYKLLHLSKQ